MKGGTVNEGTDYVVAVLKNPTDGFSEAEVEKGAKVELEHTKDLEVAKVIARAHLKENPRYYDYLDKMEKDMKKGETMEDESLYKDEISDNEPLEEKVVKRGGKYAVVHCHGKNKGKTIATHATKAGAMAQHRAIQASKHKQAVDKAVVFTSAMSQTIFTENDRPPKKWFDDCVAGVKKSGSATDPNAVCGNLWYNVKGGKENLEDTLQAFKEIAECDGCTLSEARTYIRSPAMAPKGVAVRRGVHGGFYYDEPQPQVSGEQKPEEEKHYIDPVLMAQWRKGKAVAMKRAVDLQKRL